MNIEEYIKSNYGQSQGYEYAKFLGGIDEDGKYMTDQAICRAKENLHKFRIVGFLEELSDFTTQFEKTFSRSLNMGVFNQKPKSENLSAWEFLEKNKGKIEEICQPDMEIYEYAIQNFNNRN